MAAVSLNDAGQPIFAKLDLVRGFTSESIANWAKARLSRAIVTSDGLGCFAAVTEARGASTLRESSVASSRAICPIVGFYDLTTVGTEGLSHQRGDVRHHGMSKEGLIAQQFLPRVACRSASTLDAQARHPLELA